MEFEPDQDETLAAEVAAHWFRGKESIEGELVVTDRRIVFAPHLATDVAPQEIPLAEVLDIVPTRTMLILPNGLLVRTKSGAEHRFAVSDRDRVKDLIARHLP